MSKVSRSLSIRDFYEAHKIRCKEKGLDFPSFNQYKKVLLAMGESMSDLLLENGIVALPWNVGDIFFKKKHKNPIVDLHASSKSQKRIMSFNDHSDGYSYSLFWLSPERKSKKRRLWCFSGFRGMKRASGQLFKTRSVAYPDFRQMMNNSS